jgi:uncharacterized protein YjcR
MAETLKTVLKPQGDQDQMLTQILRVREDVQVLHPLMDLLRQDEEAIANYGQRILTILSSLNDRLQTLEAQIEKDAETRESQTARIDKLLSLLEAPVP